MKGGFLTDNSSESKEILRKLISEEISHIFLSEESNFLDLRPVGGFTTNLGTNNLNSCL